LKKNCRIGLKKLFLGKFIEHHIMSAVVTFKKVSAKGKKHFSKGISVA